MATSQLGKTAIGAGVAGLLLVGGGAIAYAATGDSTPSTTSSSAPSTGSGQTGKSQVPQVAPNDGSGNSAQGGAPGAGMPGGHGGAGPRGGMGGHEHTAVNGDELAKVTAAITAKDSAIEITEVQKDPDGSYDATGTKDGQPVRVEVSADLKDVQIGQGPGGGNVGPAPGGHEHTAVTDDELTKVTEAITKMDSAVEITQVRKDPDGSYDAMGTKDGQPVRVEVSADLKDIQIGVGGPGGMGHGHGGAGMGAPGQNTPGQNAPGQSGTQPSAPSGAPPASNSSTTTT